MATRRSVWISGTVGVVSIGVHNDAGTSSLARSGRENAENAELESVPPSPATERLEQPARPPAIRNAAAAHPVTTRMHVRIVGDY